MHPPVGHVRSSRLVARRIERHAASSHTLTAVTLAGPFAVAVLLLLVGGVAKLVRPASAADALSALGANVPRPVLAIWVMGATEASIAAGALGSADRRFAVAVALCYLGFAAVVALGRFRPQQLASCGCFGTSDAPPTVVHLIIDLLGAGVAVGVAVSPFGGIGVALSRQPLFAVPFCAFVAMAVWLCYLVFSAPNLSMAAVVGGNLKGLS